MSMKEFVKQESEKYSGDFEGFSTIAKVIVTLGFQVGNFGDGSNKLFTYTKAGEGDRAKAAAVAYQKDIGSKFSPVFGVCLTILKEHILLGPQFKKDWEQHIRAWESVDNLPKFSVEQQAQLQNVTVLPFDAFITSTDSIPFGQETWARLVQITDEWQEMQVRLGKRQPNTYTSRDGQERTGKHQVYVVKEIFGSEAEAKAAADKIEASRAAKNDDLLPFSEKAKASYPDLKGLVSCAEEIHLHLSKALKGEPFMGDAESYPLPRHPDDPDKLAPLPFIKKYIADLYAIEASDIDLLRVDVPFG